MGYFLLNKGQGPAPSTPSGLAERSSGLAFQPLVGGGEGAVHTSTGIAELEPGGSLDPHLHSFEESFYVLAGSPVLDVGSTSVELGPDRCGVLPIGTAHAWRNPGGEPARWFVMQAPRARLAGEGPPDTFFVPESPAGESGGVDLRDPRNQRFFRLDPSQMDLDVLKHGSNAGEPQVSASMATALLILAARSSPRRPASASRCAPATTSGAGSAASTPSATRATEKCAGSRPPRRSRPIAAPTASTATGTTSPSSRG